MNSGALLPGFLALMLCTLTHLSTPCSGTCSQPADAIFRTDKIGTPVYAAYHPRFSYAGTDYLKLVHTPDVCCMDDNDNCIMRCTAASFKGFYKFLVNTTADNYFLAVDDLVHMKGVCVHACRVVPDEVPYAFSVRGARAVVMRDDQTTVRP